MVAPFFVTAAIASVAVAHFIDYGFAAFAFSYFNPLLF